MASDNPIFDTLNGVLAIAAAALEATTAGPAGRVFVAESPSQPWDTCGECGQQHPPPTDGPAPGYGSLWVTWTRVFPFGPFPVESPAAGGGGCSAPLALDVTVTLTRCAAPLGLKSGIPTPAAIETSAANQAEDAWAILSGLACSISQWDVAGAVIGQQPLGPQGGCLGSSTNLVVELDPGGLPLPAPEPIDEEE